MRLLFCSTRDRCRFPNALYFEDGLGEKVRATSRLIFPRETSESDAHAFAGFLSGQSNRSQNMRRLRNP